MKVIKGVISVVGEKVLSIEKCIYQYAGRSALEILDVLCQPIGKATKKIRRDTIKGSHQMDMWQVSEVGDRIDTIQLAE